MNTSPTPETDAFFAKYDTDTQWYAHLKEAKDFARKLERERDAALKLSNINVEAELLKVRAERDQLRKVCDELAANLKESTSATCLCECSVCTKYKDSLASYNSLPHVKAKGKE